MTAATRSADVLPDKKVTSRPHRHQMRFGINSRKYTGSARQASRIGIIPEEAQNMNDTVLARLTLSISSRSASIRIHSACSPPVPAALPVNHHLGPAP